MAKVSVGLRGWRFEASDIFTDDGEWRPLDEMPDDARRRLLRLGSLVDEPCDACYLVHGEAEKQRAAPATIVYGEPTDEVLLCADHEADFLYWFREAGGSERAGETGFGDDFHEWFADGGRAPEGYESLEHVEADPESLPDLPDPQTAQEQIVAESDFETRRYDLREYAEGYEPREGSDDEPTGTDDDIDVSDIDLDAEYPG